MQDVSRTGVVASIVGCSETSRGVASVEASSAASASSANPTSKASSPGVIASRQATRQAFFQ
jgi:hypothetical protein